MKERETGRFEASEETRRKCFLLANLKVLEGHLKYHNDPVGMLKDPNHSWFAEPFRDYCLNLISLKEARRQLNEIRSNVISQLTEIFYRDNLKIAHKIKTGCDFDQDLANLKGSDKKVSQEAAINLVKSFKPSYSKNPVREVVLKALIEDDENFIETIADTRAKDWIDVKKNRDVICFIIMNKEFLDDPDLSEAEVLRLAREQNVLSDMVTEEAFCKYLRRQGIQMKSKSQMRIKKFKLSLSPSIEKKVQLKKSKFTTYLFENFTPDQVRQEFEKIKKSYFSQSNLL